MGRKRSLPQRVVVLAMLVIGTGVPAALAQEATKDGDAPAWMPPATEDALAPVGGAPGTGTTGQVGSDAPWLPSAAAPAARAARRQPADAGLTAQFWFQHFAYALDYLDPPVAGTGDVLRAVADFNREFRLSNRVRLQLSDKMDVLLPVHNFAPRPEQAGGINSLREAYVSVERGSAATPIYIDLGRINVRNGVASGYNPSDFFKEAAVLTATSRDPGALRTDRLGAVMLRAQYVAAWGAATLALVPELQARPGALEALSAQPATFYLGLDRTNPRNTLYLKVTPRLSDRYSLDLSGFVREGEGPRFGVNATALLNDATVLALEAAAVRQHPLPGPLETVRPQRWTVRAAFDLTYTFPAGIEVTGEVSYAGDALDDARWQAYRRATDLAAARQLVALQTRRGLEQEPLTRYNWFGRIAWRNALHRNGLSLAGFASGNLLDGSLLWQVSASQALAHVSIGLLASGYEGNRTSEFGQAPMHRYVAAFVSRRF